MGDSSCDRWACANFLEFVLEGVDVIYGVGGREMMRAFMHMVCVFKVSTTTRT